MLKSLKENLTPRVEALGSAALGKNSCITIRSEAVIDGFEAFTAWVLANR